MTALIHTENMRKELLLERAKNLHPILRARARESEANRVLSKKTITDFQDAGFFKILQPKKFGGYEMDPRTFFDVVIEIAAACPSSAWVLGVIGVHNWQLALFPKETQQEVWGPDNNILVSSSYMPAGKVEVMDGGYNFSGKWGFSSGSDHCDWVFLGGFVPPSKTQKHPEMRTFLLPKSDFSLVDDWFTSGLKGTGSKSVLVEDAFVPENRTHKMSDGFRRKSPGHEINDSWIYKIPFGQIFTRSVATPAIGMAKGALEAYKEVTSKKVGRADGAKVALDPQSQEVCAQAALAIDEAHSLLHRDYESLKNHAIEDTEIPLEERVRFRYNSSVTTDKCVKAVDGLFTASGGGAIFQANEINRFFQDIHAARAHYANNPSKSGRNLGGVMLGQQTADWFI